MTSLTLNLENCTKEEKQKAINITCCYTKTQIDRNTNCVTVEIEDQVVSHLISSLPSSVTITNQEKLENSEVTPQVIYHNPSGWLIVNVDYYNDLHLKISELTVINSRLQKLAESNCIPTDHVYIDKEEYNQLQQIVTDREKTAAEYIEKYSKLYALYKDLTGTLSGIIDTFPKNV